MSDLFQTQSQWENEHEVDMPVSGDNSKKKGITVSKRTLMIVGILLAFSIISAGAAYTYGRSIEGIWIRQMDDFTSVAGMTVEVRRNNGKLEGVIIAMPAGAESFEVGQIKWLSIRKTGFGRYKCFGLSGWPGEYQYDNVEDDLIVSSNSDQLTFYSNDADAGLGKIQVWVKQKNK